MTARERAEAIPIHRFTFADVMVDEIEKSINEAILAEREACKALAEATEVQAGRLIQSARNDFEREYYRGRGLASAQIAERIGRRG